VFDPGVAEPPVADAVLRRLGEPAVLRGSPEVMRGLRKAYETVGRRALQSAMSSDAERDNPAVGRKGSPGRRERRG
jgi:hypothetical protein